MGYIIYYILYNILHIIVILYGSFLVLLHVLGFVQAIERKAFGRAR